MEAQTKPVLPQAPFVRTAVSDAVDTKKAVIIYGPQGCGKTHNANVLAAYLGKSNMADDWQVGDLLPPATACFTNDDRFAHCKSYRPPYAHSSVSVLKFDDVLIAFSRSTSDAKQLPATKSDLASTAALSDDSVPIDVLKNGISKSIDFALTQYPVNTINNSTTGERVKFFASHLSGWLEETAEQELADKVFSMFKRSDQ